MQRDNWLYDDEQPQELTPEQVHRLDEAWIRVLDDQHGRRMLYRILQLTMFGASAFGGTSEATLYNSGKQEIGAYVMSMINRVMPEAWTLMNQEAQQENDYDRRNADYNAAGNATDGRDAGDNQSGIS